MIGRGDDLKAEGAHTVDHARRAAAGRCHHRDAVALRGLLSAHQRRQLEKGLEHINAQHSMRPEERLGHFVAARHCAGVRSGEILPDFRAPKLVYDHGLACGAICASGTLGQIIPPSIILILMGDIMGVSVGDLYIGAVVPGLLLVALYVAYLAAISWWKPDLAPAIPAVEIAAFRTALLKRVGLALLPAFVLVVGVLGSIFAGVASPTEAASVGAAGGIILTVLIPEALGPLILGYTFLLIGIIDMSALAGYVGGGGLGNFAIVYGYQRFNWEVTLVTVVIIIVIVQLAQVLGNWLARRALHR